jgi:HSP20 family protein
MNSLFDDFFTKDLKNWGSDNFSNTNTTIPAVNIRETGENFEVEVAAPGMDKNDFKLELNGNQLTISCERETENNVSEEKRYTRQEFSYQSFQRTLQLPQDVVDADKIKAHYRDGLLQLTIPQREEAKLRPPRMIEIA